MQTYLRDRSFQLIHPSKLLKLVQTYPVNTISETGASLFKGPNNSLNCCKFIHPSEIWKLILTYPTEIYESGASFLFRNQCSKMGITR